MTIPLTSLTTDEAVLEIVRDVVRQTAPAVPADKVTLAATMDDLGLDSLATMELVGVLEQRLAIRFPDSELARLGSLQQLIALIRKTQQRA